MMPNSKCIENPGLLVEFSLAPWDEAACGFPVAQLTRFEVWEHDPTLLHPAWAEFEAWRDAAHVGLVSCRIGANKVREGLWLESAGFRFIEMVLQPTIMLDKGRKEGDSSVEVAIVGPDDIECVAEIARTAFVTDRFTVDPRLPRCASGKRYQRWVESTFGHPTQRLHKAQIDGVVAGFFITENASDGSCYWHLTAVAPAFHGRGYGKRIWRAMMDKAKDDGAVKVTTTIAVRNIPVLNLYAGLGFRFGTASSTYHWVRC